MRGFPERRDPGGEARTRHRSLSLRAPRRRRARDQVRLGTFDGLDGRAGRVIRGLLGEAVARLERGGRELRGGKSLARTLRQLDASAVATDPEVAGATLVDLLAEISSALGALGQAAGARAADSARATAERLAAAGRARSKRARTTDAEAARELAELEAGHLPEGFRALSVVHALLA